MRWQAKQMNERRQQRNFGSPVYDIIGIWRSVVTNGVERFTHTDNLTVRIVCCSDAAVSCKCAIISCSTWWRFNNITIIIIIIWNSIREKRFIYIVFISSFGALQQLFSMSRRLANVLQYYYIIKLYYVYYCYYYYYYYNILL